MLMFFLIVPIYIEAKLFFTSINPIPFITSGIGKYVALI